MLATNNKRALFLADRCRVRSNGTFDEETDRGRDRERERERERESEIDVQKEG